MESLKTLFCLLLWLLLAASDLLGQTMARSPAFVGAVNARAASAATTESAMVVNTYVDLNVTNADGTTLTTTILANGSHGDVGAAAADWAINGSGLTVESAGTNRLGKVYVMGSGTSYATNSTVRRLALSNLQTLAYATLSCPVNFASGSMACWITFGQTNAGASGVVFDVLSILKGSGYAIAQLNNGNGGAGVYGICLHSNPGGVTSQSSFITLTPGSTYWVSLQADYAAATGQLDVYDTGGSLVGSVNASLFATTGVTDTSAMRIGNAQSGTSSGTTYFHNICIDFGNAPKPFGPTGPTTYWVPKWAGVAGTVTSGGTIVTPSISVTAGDLVVVGGKWEGTTTTATCADSSANALTNSVVGVKDNSGASGEPHTVLFWYIAPSTATLSYTITLGASKTYRDGIVAAFTKPSGYGTPALDGTSVAGESSSSTAPNSGNITTTGTKGIAVGFYGTYGAIGYRPLINSLLPNGTAFAATSKSAMFFKEYTSGFTGDSAMTLSSANRWNQHVIGFSAP